MSRIYMVISVFMGLLAATPALASDVREILQRREDLSVFLQLLEVNGVLDEVSSGSYTILAPTNDAFAKLPQDKYACFYSGACKEEAANILRNHFVRGEVDLADVNAVFSIDQQHITVGRPYKGQVSVQGQLVTSEMQLLGGMLYKIDGVIAEPQELADLRYSPAAVKSEEEVYRSPSGRPDGYSKTTVIETYGTPAR